MAVDYYSSLAYKFLVFKYIVNCQLVHSKLILLYGSLYSLFSDCFKSMFINVTRKDAYNYMIQPLTLMNV